MCVILIWQVRFMIDSPVLDAVHDAFDWQVAELEEILRGGRRMKAVANTILMMNKTKSTNIGQAGSQACVLQ